MSSGPRWSSPTTETTQAGLENTEPGKTGCPDGGSAPKAEKPRRKQRYWTEGRIIGELHRHGIYW